MHIHALLGAATGDGRVMETFGLSLVAAFLGAGLALGAQLLLMKIQATSPLSTELWKRQVDLGLRIYETAQAGFRAAYLATDAAISEFHELDSLNHRELHLLMSPSLIAAFEEFCAEAEDVAFLKSESNSNEFRPAFDELKVSLQLLIRRIREEIHVTELVTSRKGAIDEAIYLQRWLRSMDSPTSR